MCYLKNYNIKMTLIGKSLFFPFLIGVLSSCSNPPPEPPYKPKNGFVRSETSIIVPSKKQLEFSLEKLPPSLFRHDVSANSQQSKPSSKPEQASVSLSKTHQALTAQKIQPREVNFEINADNVANSFDFDPFNGNAEFNRTEAACGLPPNYEPSPDMAGSSLHQYGTSSFCLITVAKLAVMRAVGNYSIFSQILPSIADGLALANNPKGILQAYNNAGVTSLGATGLRINLFYDDCINQKDVLTADPKAFIFCTGELDNTIYHRISLYPLIPKNGTTTTTGIGEMEWLIKPDASSSGSITISRNLMTESEFIDFAPPQIQYDFESDTFGKFQSFTLKYAPQLPPGGSVSRDSIWNANVIRVSKIPENGTNPAIWTVQGNIQFTLNLGTNPLYTGAFTFEPFGHLATPRVYFSAVAEDVFVDGNAVYQAIMTDGPGLDKSLFPESSWTNEFHLWSAYKKMLQYNYTEEHYELVHNFADPQLMYAFDRDTAQIASIIKMGTHDSHIRRVDINSTTTQAVTASSDGTIGVWDIDPTSPTFQQKTDEFLAPHGVDTVNHVQYSPVDDNLILSTGHDGFARIFDLTTKLEVLSFDQLVSNTTFTVHADWSSDGSRIATVSNQGTKIWDAVSGNKIADLGDYGFGIRNVDFDPSNNNFVLTSGAITDTHLWDISSPTTPVISFTDPDAGNVTDATFSPDGSQLSIVNDTGFLYVWDRTNNVAPLKSEVLMSGGAQRGGVRVEWPNDGSKIFAQAWGSIIMFDAITLTYDETYVGYANPYDTNGLTSFVVLPDNNTALVGHNGAGTQPVYVEGYDLNAGDKALAFYTPDRVTTYDANYSPDGSHIVSASIGGQVDIWNSFNSSYIQTLAGHTAAVYTARFSPDGSKIVSASADGTAKIWDAVTGIALFTVSHPNNPPLTSASFSSDGSQIITASGRRGTAIGNGTVMGWEVSTGASASATTNFPNVNYQWIPSALGTNEYYLTDSLGDDPALIAPTQILINTTPSVSGTLGSLADNQWAYGDNDTLGFETVYLSSTTDPNTVLPDFISIEHTMSLVTGATAANDVAFSPTDNQHLVVSTNIGAQWWATNNTATPVCTFNSNANTQSAEVSPDGLRVITASGTSAQMWGVEPSLPSTFCTQIGIVGIPSIQHAKFSPNDGGKFVVVQGGSSGSSGAAYFALYDMDPLSPNFQALVASFAEPAAQPQLRRPLTNVSFSPDAKRIISSGTAKAVNPAWLDFDGWFAELDGNGKLLRPDENDNANPYYVDLVDTNVGCFTTDLTGNCGGTTGFLTCAEVGGCKSYSVVSQFTHDQNGTTPDPKFDYLKSQLDVLAPQWMIENFVSKTIE